MTVGSTAPGPRGDLLLGSTLDFKESPLEFVSYVHRAYGDVARFRVGPSHWYLMAHPEDIWDAMVRKPDIFVKPNIAKRLWEKFLGDGLLTLEGADWKRMHKLVRPAFHKKRIDAYGQTMVNYTHRLVDGLEPNSQIDFDAAMVSLTLEIVAKTLFDADVREGSEQVAKAMHVLNVEMLNHIHSPIPVPRWWPSARNKRKLSAIANIEGIVRAVIEERRRDGKDRGDLLSTLVFTKTEDGESMTDKEIRDQAMTLFFAGHETTAHAMTWAWYLLARHPHVTARLQADIDAVTQGRRLTIADLKALPYLDQVIKEAMRILPSVWVFIKQPTEDVVVRGVKIPKGSPVLISPYVVHHDARWFPSPETFDPDRFSPARAAELPNGAYIPFSGGQRVCIGRNFAMMEARLIIGSLLQRLQPSVPKGVVPVKQAVLSMQPLDGLPAEVTFRRPLLGAAASE